MSKAMIYGALMIHLSVGLAFGILTASMIGDAGGFLLWLMLFVAGVLLYLVLVGAIGLFLTYVIGISEEDDDEQYDER